MEVERIMRHTWMTLAIALLTSVVAYAQNFAVVDFRRVQEESTYVKQRFERLQAMQNRYAQLMQVMQENIHLTDEERQQLYNLLKSENLTDAQRQEIQQLTNTARQRRSELQALRQKPDPTETEKVALQQFSQMEVRGQEALQVMAQQLAQELERAAQSSDEELNKLLREIIAQIAKERKITMVFSAGVVLYAENDLTSEVIKRLDARK